MARLVWSSGKEGTFSITESHIIVHGRPVILHTAVLFLCYKYRTDMLPLDTTTGTTSSTKWLSGLAFSIAGPLLPLRPLAIVLILFIAIDFITGLMASWHRGEGFCSKKMWRTIYKTAFALTGIVMAHLLDEIVLLPAIGSPLYLSRYFTAFVCGTEFWSFLENASELSQHPIFEIVRKLMNNRIKKATGEDIDKTIMEIDDEQD